MESLLGGQVEEGCAVHGLAGEVRGYPRGDLRAVVAATRAVPAAEAAAADEVVDLSVGHVLLELGERRGGIAAVEAADRHHRVTGGELIARGVLRAHRRGHPGV